MLENGKSYILTNNSSNCVIDYYQYIVSILQYILNKNNLSINIILGNNEYNFNNKNKTIKIDINYEHTLVKEGGRSVPKNTPIGAIKYNKDEKYYVRIDNFQTLNFCDIILDYSLPNIYNAKTCDLFKNLSNKHIYISPCIYQNIYTNMKNRNINSLTTFINTNEPRRKKLLENIKKSNLHHNNVNNCFDKTELQKLYQNTKVIINIHQTEHHDTFEELRCLPALQNGVIVVAEKSPLNNLIPYNDLIIWSDYDNIIEKTKEVLNNFEKYHSLIFTKKNIDILKNLDMENKNEIEKMLSDKEQENKERNFLYIMIPKTACVSIDAFLKTQKKNYLNILKNDGLWSMSEISNINSKNKSLSFGHADIKSIINKNILDYEIYKNLYKFTVVRNPYDRLVSLFFYNKFNEEMTFNKFIETIYKKEILIPKLNEKNIIQVEGYNDLNSRRFINQFNLQVDWIPDDCDNILNFENINEDFKNLGNILNIKSNKTLQVLNKTDLKNNDFMSYYNDTTIQMVNEIYDKDFEILNYKKIIPSVFNINNINKDKIINIVFYSNCQNKGISFFIEKYFHMKGIKINIDCSMQNYQMISKKIELPKELLLNADIFIYQPIDKRHGIYSTCLNNKSNIISYLKEDCLKISFPYIYNSSTWAIITPSPGDGITNGGFFNDVNKYINREAIEKMKINNHSLDSIIKLFREKKIDFNYKNRFQNDLTILKKKELECNIIVSDYIEQNIYKKELFLNQGHPTTPLFIHSVNQIIKMLNDNYEFPYDYPEQYFVGNGRLSHSSMDKYFWNFPYNCVIDDSIIIKHIEYIYNSNINYSLETYCKHYALDKIPYYDLNANYVWGHNYIKIYKLLFDRFSISEVKNILEIGLGFILKDSNTAFSKDNYKHGNSLRMWRDYFTEASVYGIDINKNLMFTENRIKTFVANQNSEQDLQLVMDKIDTKLDIIIDDGSHMGEHQVFSFIHLNKHLSDNGIYVIEDVQPPHINGFKDLSIFPADFKEYINKNFNVEYFDTRNTGRPDDFIVSFTKK